MQTPQHFKEAVKVRLFILATILLLTAVVGIVIVVC